jgi:hypothetical protein
MNMSKKIQLVAGMSLLISSQAMASIPMWVLNPTSDDGIAAVSCVQFSGNLSSDAKLASANVRLALSQQIATRVIGMDEVYESRNSVDQNTTISTNFSSVSKQETKQLLKGVNVAKTDLVDIMGQTHLCALAVLEPARTKSFFNELLKQSGVDVSADEKSALYRELTRKDDNTEQEAIQKATGQ